MTLEEGAEPPVTGNWRPRRQNQSCDACRTAKRRCSPSDIDDTGGRVTICTNCFRLGHKCTYEFARARQQHQSTRKGTKKSGLANGPDRHVIAPADRSWLETDVESPVLQRSQEHLPTQSNIEPDLGPDLSFLWPPSNLSPLDDVFVGFSSATYLDELIVPANRLANSGSTASGSESPPAGQQSANSVIKASNNRITQPALMLSSSLSDSMVGEVLARVYNSIIARNSMRWLRFEANPYASSSPYKLLSNDLQQETPAGSGHSKPAANIYQDHSATMQEFGAIETYDRHSPPKMTNQKPPLSLLGAVRFLDHFSDLYGNRLGVHGRKMSDSAIKTSLTAYSMQWLPAQTNPQPLRCSERHSFQGFWNQQGLPIQTTYYQSWNRAKDTIEKAHGLKSFRLVYATLLFDATAPPADLQKDVSCKNTLLQSAFAMLQELGEMVTQHAKRLGTASVYAGLLESSLAVVQWLAHLRDLTSSLINPRRPRPPELLPGSHQNELLGLNSFHGPNWLIFEDIPQALGDPQNFSFNLNALDNSVWEFLGQHVPRLLSTTRAICTARADFTDALSITYVTATEGHGPLLSVIGAIDSMRVVIGSFFEVCVENLDFLSAESKLLVAILVLLWNLGLLTLTEIPIESAHIHTTAEGQPLSTTLRAYQRTAISAITQLSKHILADPFPEHSTLCDDLDAETRMTGYHLAPDLAVVAMRKAIEQQVGLGPRAAVGFDDQGNYMSDYVDVEQWTDSLDQLLKGLLALKVSVGGSQSAGFALENLLRDYGDFLSECWSADFET